MIFPMVLAPLMLFFRFAATALVTAGIRAPRRALRAVERGQVSSTLQHLHGNIALVHIKLQQTAAQTHIPA